MTMILSPAQTTTLDEIKNAPDYDCVKDQWCDCFKRDDGVINGNWNTLTLKALANRGLIEIIEIGDFWNDKVILV